jgi:hypothetical protein
MKIPTCCRIFALCALAITPAHAQTPSAAPDPHLARLEQRGAATQLIVNGRPFLVLGGETDNTAASSLAYMDTVWPKLAQANLNTVLVGVGWDWIEPVEGQYDFSLVDGILKGARKNHLHLILLWFGSWKNGLSSFAPEWVKVDQQRFPRALLKNGKSVEVLSTLSDENLQADTRAYTAFMHHLREADGGKGTVIMIQLENEVGLIGDSRDRSAAAEAAFAGPVPAELTAYLQSHRESLWPDLRTQWESAGAKTAGTWTEVFGDSPETDGIFMAWHYARYMDHLARAGKAEYPLPVFSNTWLVQPEDKVPGDYPSGCPEPLVIDIWKAGAPAIDINAPDVHLPNFNDWAARFRRPNNPLFVPESSGDAGGAANAVYGIGQYASIGYSPFGVNRLEGWTDSRNGSDASISGGVEKLPLARAYTLLKDMTPLIVDAQTKGTIGAAWLNTGLTAQDVTVGNYTLHVALARNRRTHALVASVGYALVIATGPDEYYVAGRGVEVTFSPNTPGPSIAGLARAETGRFEKGRWIPGRRMNGDDVLLDYNQAAAAAGNQSGSGLMFGNDGPVIQHVKLYRYQ